MPDERPPTDARATLLADTIADLQAISRGLNIAEDNPRVLPRVDALVDRRLDILLNLGGTPPVDPPPTRLPPVDPPPTRPPVDPDPPTQPPVDPPTVPPPTPPPTGGIVDVSEPQGRGRLPTRADFPKRDYATMSRIVSQWGTNLNAVHGSNSDAEFLDYFFSRNPGKGSVGATFSMSSQGSAVFAERLAFRRCVWEGAADGSVPNNSRWLNRAWNVRDAVYEECQYFRTNDEHALYENLGGNLYIVGCLFEDIAAQEVQLVWRAHETSAPDAISIPHRIVFRENLCLAADDARGNGRRSYRYSLFGPQQWKGTPAVPDTRNAEVVIERNVWEMNTDTAANGSAPHAMSSGVLLVESVKRLEFRENRIEHVKPNRAPIKLWGVNSFGEWDVDVEFDAKNHVREGKVIIANSGPVDIPAGTGGNATLEVWRAETAPDSNGVRQPLGSWAIPGVGEKTSTLIHKGPLSDGYAGPGGA